METLNGQVAIAPFKKDESNDQRVKGLDLRDLTVTKLIETTVLFGSHKYCAGDILYFRADILKFPQASQKLKLGDVEFILLPDDLPVLMKRKSLEGENGRPKALEPSSNGQP